MSGHQMSLLEFIDTSSPVEPEPAPAASPVALFRRTETDWDEIAVILGMSRAELDEARARVRARMRKYLNDINETNNER